MSDTNQLSSEVNEYASHHQHRIVNHYEHARTKHPHFADRIADYEHTDDLLLEWRNELRSEIDGGCVYSSTVLGCEVSEIYDAYSRGDAAHAVEECYDAIAVLLRMVDALEGRQKLGKEARHA